MNTHDKASAPDRRWVRAALARYEAPLLRYARSIVWDVETARDVVQETFLRLWQAQRGAVEDHLAEWLFTVCRNRALDVRRKEDRMQQTAIPTTRRQARTPSEEAEQRQSLGLALRAMEALPDNQREVLRLKFQGGLSYKQISAVTGLSVSNVGTLIHVGLKNVRETLASGEQNPGRVS